MVKNFILLGLLSWVSFAYATEHSVVQPSMEDARSYKVESATREQEATRAVAGGKMKRKSPVEMEESKQVDPSEIDSEVRYWQYSE